jgi:hypothetical protein
MSTLEIVFYVCEIIAMVCSLIVILFGRGKVGKVVLVSNWIIFVSAILAMIFWSLAILNR